MEYLIAGINAKYIHSNLAIHSLKAYADKYCQTSADNNIQTAEYTINMPVSDIVRGIYELGPDFLALSVYIWNVDIVMQVIRDIHILMPDIMIFLGGPEVSYNCEAILKNYPEVDGIMIGEGEATFCELVDTLSADSLADFSNISGLCFRDRSDSTVILYTSSRPCLDLSTVPFPYTDISLFNHKIVYYESSRGCPFGCSYCLSSVDKQIRFRDLDLVKKELLFFIDAMVPQVKFVDRTFNIDHKRSLELLQFLKENDNGVTNFHFEIAGDILTEEEIIEINSLRPGLIKLEIGVQSTNQPTLEAIHRHISMDKLKENVARLTAPQNVHLHLDLIAGLPYENLERFRESFNSVYSMGGHELQLGFLKVLSGAPIHDLIDEQQIRYSKHAPYEVLSTKYLSFEDINELKLVEEMLEIYHNSCQFSLSEAFLLELDASPYDLYLGLARHYLAGNIPILQSKRAVRYEQLLSYASDHHNLNDSDYASLSNLLTLDYYMREKAKARPDFAPELTPETKRQIHMLSEKINFSSNIHIEPVYGKDEYAVFNYEIKSPITGNCEVTYLRNSSATKVSL